DGRRASPTTDLAEDGEGRRRRGESPTTDLAEDGEGRGRAESVAHDGSRRGRRETETAGEDDDLVAVVFRG
ncbi:MAG TPA: hypothetical protein VN085_00035, partial [Vicinamibacterales bacterium]|nr:hypothetical protein [Vicinamibacterales bacterium]